MMIVSDQQFIWFAFQEYMFDPKKLIPFGPPPNDRGCLVCGKVGHKAKECEFSRNNRRAVKAKQSPKKYKPVRPSLNRVFLFCFHNKSFK